MMRAQQYLTTLLERIPKWELATEEQRTMFDQIKDRMTGSQDFGEDLSNLFKVANCSEFALGLMWIAETVEADFSKLESTADEEAFILALFRRATGESDVEIPPIAMTAEVQPVAEPQPESPWGADLSPAVETMTPAEPVVSEPGVATGEREFSALLEQFLVSVQSGAEDRTELMGRVLQQCDAVGSSSEDQDYQQFCTHLREFLDYATANQLLDDVRVMNILANVQEPFSQWSATDQDQRPGILGPAIDVLRDFKTMFE